MSVDIIGIDSSKLVHRIYDESEPQKVGESENFHAKYQSFAKHVSPQLSQINILFDEYTPHDDTHMKSLFKIADGLLGEEVINNLNGCEACILACSVYGHDWGMAVSKNEKTLIVTGKTLEEGTESFSLLKDERYKWKEHAKLNALATDDNGFLEDDSLVSKDIWREYVRKTHAERAKVRSIRFFGGDDSTLGEIIGEVCAGHWYDIAQISQLSRRKLALGKKVNLQALATYMRFIDLLDIGKNRTPYSLWKFVSPQNLFSANEWKKHRALEPVDFERSESKVELLNIVVQGKTSDHRVYAALKDMENWVSSQVKENELILRELGTYSLGHIKLDWEIEADGFEPIDIRFEFDRSKMFELIAGEIYNNDPYVFLRELLQNSIDATRVREKLAEEDGYSIALENFTLSIDVEHKANGDACIKFADSGTGMSLNIIRNYLSVIGKSYYRSNEFDNLGLEIEPISRFGVGLISCFEVADSVTIETRNDHQVSEKSDAFKIEIENYNHQFRVERLPKDSINVGTAITVKVLGSKWRKGEFSDTQNLRVTEYLKAVAGFVKYPIFITESNLTTLILSPTFSHLDIARIKEKHNDVEIWQLPLSLEPEEIFLDHDLNKAKVIYKQHRLTIGTKKINGYTISGGLSYFLPKENLVGSIRNVAGSQYGVTSVVNIDGLIQGVPIRWKSDDDTNIKYDSISTSAYKSPYRSLYINGVLVPNLSNDILHFRGDYLPSSYITININTEKSAELSLSLSRKELKVNKFIIESLLKPIYQEEFGRLYKAYEEELNTHDLYERFILLAYLKQYLPKSDQLFDFYPFENWLAPFMNRSGEVVMIEVKNIPSTIEVLPKRYLQDYNNRNNRQGIWHSWSMKNYLTVKHSDVANFFTDDTDSLFIKSFGLEYDDGSFMEWNTIEYFLSYELLKNNYNKVGLRIADYNAGKYIIERWEKSVSSTVSSSTVILHDFEFVNFDDASAHICFILPVEKTNLSKNEVREMIFNANHPLSQILKKALLAYEEKKATIPSHIEDKLRVEYRSHPLSGKLYSDYKSDFLQVQTPKWIKRFCLAVESCGVVSLSEAEKTILDQPFEAYACYK
jgi:hypothetical protein